MSDEIQKENRPCLDRSTFLAEIERLYVEGYPTRQIAQLLHEDGNKVGRNLREIKRRWARAAGRQRAALAQTQCAAVYREAVSGWRCSQQPRLTTTEHRDDDGKVVKTIVRRQEGPGDKTFLLAAVGALKTLRQFAQAQAGSASEKDHDAGDPMYLAILQTLTPEQVDRLTHEQLQRVRLAVDRFRAEVDRFHAEVEAFRREKAGDRGYGPTDSPAADNAAPASEPALPDPSEDSEPVGGEAAPPADGLQSAAAPQRQAGEPPLLAAHAERQLLPGGLPAADESPLAHVAETAVTADSPAAVEESEQEETSGFGVVTQADGALWVARSELQAKGVSARRSPRPSLEAQDVPPRQIPPVPTHYTGGPLLATSPDTAAPDKRAPVLIGGPRTAPPTAAEHQAYQQWLAQQFGIAPVNLLPAQGLRPTPSHAPPAANLAGGASEARSATWTEAMSR